MTNTSEKYERTQQGNMLVLTMTTVVVKMLTMTNWEVYLKWRLERNRGNSDCLWERNQTGMCTLLRLLIFESQKIASLSTDVEVRPHQLKKLSVSLCAKYWPRTKELHLERVTGNKSFATLERCYIKKAPRLGMVLSLPLGTAPLKGR